MKVVEENDRNESGPISNTRNKDPTKSAVLRAMESCLARFGDGNFGANMASALIQKPVCFLHSYSLEVEKVPY